MKNTYDPYAICKKCKQQAMDVVHCKECCGWGLTKNVKYHKFVSEKIKCPRKKNCAAS